MFRSPGGQVQRLPFRGRSPGSNLNSILSCRQSAHNHRRLSARAHRAPGSRRVRGPRRRAGLRTGQGAPGGIDYAARRPGSGAHTRSNSHTMGIPCPKRCGPRAGKPPRTGPHVLPRKPPVEKPGRGVGRCGKCAHGAGVSAVARGACGCVVTRGSWRDWGAQVGRLDSVLVAGGAGRYLYDHFSGLLLECCLAPRNGPGTWPCSCASRGWDSMTVPKGRRALCRNSFGLSQPVGPCAARTSAIW
jgi:hypothetical protein